MQNASRAILVLTILLFQLPAISFAESYDFRKAKWGMSVPEVKQTETNPVVYDSSSKTFDRIISYKTKVAGLDTFYSFQFIGNILVSSVYTFQEKHSNKNQYISDYNKVKELLTNKYGEPESDKVIWNNDLFKEKPESHGLAISLGHVICEAVWKTPSTLIILQLKGDSQKVSMILSYASTAYESVVNKRQQLSDQDGL